MTPDLPPLDRLPQRSESDVKDQWPELVRDVHRLHALAICDSSESSPPVVLIDAGTYNLLTSRPGTVDPTGDSSLQALKDRFELRLSAMQTDDAREKLDAALASKGKLKHRPRAGSDF